MSRSHCDFVVQQRSPKMDISSFLARSHTSSGGLLHTPSVRLNQKLTFLLAPYLRNRTAYAIWRRSTHVSAKSCVERRRRKLLLFSPSRGRRGRQAQRLLLGANRCLSVPNPHSHSNLRRRQCQPERDARRRAVVPILRPIAESLHQPDHLSVQLRGRR